MNEMMVIHYIHIGIIKNKEDFYFFDNKISIIPRFECFRIYIKIMTSISSTIKSLLSSAAAYQWQLEFVKNFWKSWKQKQMNSLFLKFYKS